MIERNCPALNGSTASNLSLFVHGKKKFRMGTNRPVRRRVPLERHGGPFPRKPSDSWRSDRHLEFLGGAEGHPFARLDLDRLAGRRIAAHAGGTLAHLQDAEPGDSYPLAFLQVLSDQADEVLQHLLALLLGKLMLVRKCVGQMLSGDRLAGLGFRRSGCYCFHGILLPHAHHAPWHYSYEIRRPAARDNHHSRRRIHCPAFPRGKSAHALARAGGRRGAMQAVLAPDSWRPIRSPVAVFKGSLGLAVHYYSNDDLRRVTACVLFSRPLRLPSSSRSYSVGL